MQLQYTTHDLLADFFIAFLELVVEYAYRLHNLFGIGDWGD